MKIVNDNMSVLCRVQGLVAPPGFDAEQSAVWVEYVKGMPYCLLLDFVAGVNLRLAADTQTQRAYFKATKDHDLGRGCKAPLPLHFPLVLKRRGHVFFLHAYDGEELSWVLVLTGIQA